MEGQLQVVAAMLRGLRNSMQPVNRLPPELLASIFTRAQLHLPSFLPLLPADPTYVHPHRSWFSLLHVCRFWRNIIAHSPAQWSTIYSAFIPDTFLQLSAAVPLTIYLGFKVSRADGAIALSRSRSKELVDIMAPHTARFTQFHVDLEGWQGESCPFNSFNSPAPQLFSLAISTNGKDFVDGVLPPLFSGEMPNLQQLSLKYFTSWPKGYFGGLTHLCLYDQCDETRSTTADFLDLLEASPRLEELALVRAGPTRSEGADLLPSSTRSVALKNLRELNIGDWPSASIISRFLAFLTLPKKTNMYLWGETLLSPDEDIGTIIPSDATRLANLYAVKEWYFIRQRWLYFDTALVAVVNSVLYIYASLQDSQISPAAVARYPLSKVRKAAVRDFYPSPFQSPSCLSTATWSSILEQLPALRTLKIFAGDAPGGTRAIINALRPETAWAPSWSPSDTPMVCRHLKSLHIMEDCSLPILQICKLAKERAAHGSCTKKLQVKLYDRPADRSRSSVPDDAVNGGEWGYDSDSDMGTIGNHVQGVEYITPLTSMAVTPSSWPNQTFNWTRRSYTMGG